VVLRLIERSEAVSRGNFFRPGSVNGVEAAEEIFANFVRIFVNWFIHIGRGIVC